MKTVLQDRAGVRGRVELVVRDARTGAVLERIVQRNLVVDAGLNLQRDFLQGQVVAPLSHFAYGTSNTAAAAGQTALVAEVFRGAITQTDRSTSKHLVLTHYLSSTQANGNTLKEIGLFNDMTSGTMFARAVLSASITKTTAVTVTATWTITWSAS